jgi:hypothetical protein
VCAVYDALSVSPSNVPCALKLKSHEPFTLGAVPDPVALIVTPVALVSVPTA